MPVAVCYCKTLISTDDLEKIVDDWAELTGVSREEVSITIVNDFIRAGKQYSVVANLFLPSLWKKNEVIMIEKGFLKLLSKYMQIKKEEVFIMTIILPSQHVIDNGDVVSW